MPKDESIRSCGLWLHVTALPGPRGCGTLGRPAFDFIDSLAKNGQSYWQILPINPVREGFNYSPYSPASSFAGNPLLIDEQLLVDEFSLPIDCLVDFPDTASSNRCEWNERWVALKAILWKIFAEIETQLLKKQEFIDFCRHNCYWLDDYSIFESMVDYFGSCNWRNWPELFRFRDPNTLCQFAKDHSRSILWQRFVQYMFFSQWRRLKEYSRSLGVEIMGDMPIYAQFDSADVWAHPDVFEMDLQTLHPKEVAGVPPDYFSQDGQLWGNPLYRWYNGESLHHPTMAWWRERLKLALEITDLVRIDHFRGLESFWSIPATAKTAREGIWRKGPGIEFFEQLHDVLGENPPLVAEDLGVITPAVEKLRDHLGLPGMKILHFAFANGDDHPYLPHNFDKRPCLLYLGTHDNNTTTGWLNEEISEAEKERVSDYISWSKEPSLIWRLIETALASTAQTVMLSVNDLLEYGSETRFNVPGRAAGNWSWKLCSDEDLRPAMQKLFRLCQEHQRLGNCDGEL